jgi:hypothetical protein
LSWLQDIAIPLRRGGGEWRRCGRFSFRVDPGQQLAPVSNSSQPHGVGIVKMLHGRNFMEVILFRHACPILLHDAFGSTTAAKHSKSQAIICSAWPSGLEVHSLRGDRQTIPFCCLPFIESLARTLAMNIELLSKPFGLNLSEADAEPFQAQETSHEDRIFRRLQARRNPRCGNR